MAKDLCSLKPRNTEIISQLYPAVFCLLIACSISAAAMEMILIAHFHLTREKPKSGAFPSANICCPSTALAASILRNTLTETRKQKM